MCILGATAGMSPIAALCDLLLMCDCSFTMYEDDGITREYIARQTFSTYSICWEDGASTVTVSQRQGSFTGYVQVGGHSCEIFLLEPSDESCSHRI